MDRRLLFKTCSGSPEELERELLGTTINGHKFELRDTTSVTEICGDIGSVYPPCDYARWPHARLYSMHDLHDGLVGYAAVRFKGKGKQIATFVIDAFGISKNLRSKGAGRALFDYIKADICDVESHAGSTPSWRKALIDCGMQQETESYTLSIQSTFEFQSYCEAVAAHTVEERSRDGSHTVTIDMASVIKEVRGSCDFWRRMGFTNEKIICNNGFNVAAPILIMWQKIK